MAKPTILGSKTKYQLAYEVDLNAKMTCGRTGISKKWGELTDEDIEAINPALINGKEGNKNFQLIPAATVNAPKADPTVTAPAAKS